MRNGVLKVLSKEKKSIRKKGEEAFDLVGHSSF